MEDKRGTLIKPVNSFIGQELQQYDDYAEYLWRENEKWTPGATTYLEVHPKSIVNRVPSDDIGFDWSVNPYQGCEHGCVYCYARNSHEYWGYNAGLDFEQVVMVKSNAAELVEKKFRSKSWTPATIMLSGNTDCYQPIEAQMKLTRSILELCRRYKNPVGVITKNALILRDLDIISDLARHRLIKVAVSLTSLDVDLQQVLEPRTSTPNSRLRMIRKLSEAGVYVTAMVAPVIPGINSDEVMSIVKEAAAAGARHVQYIPVRLPGKVKDVMVDWLERRYPNRKEKVLNQIRDYHRGAFTSTVSQGRMRGAGAWADQLRQQVEIARKRYLPDFYPYSLNTDLFAMPDQQKQLSIFD